jgi:aminoglycoside 6'-N-acetyltransferase I
MMQLEIRRARYPKDKGQLMEMWLALYTWITDADAEWTSMADWFARADAATFVAVDAGQPESLVGYADVGERSVVDGCDGPAAYLEAWYVRENWRRKGVGEALLEACETWARSRGYTEMGSDALLDNLESQRLHRKFGFEEHDRVVTFRKTL